ncbi:LCP family protein [Lacrimispora amygdalina]|uniref:LCP family protein n=1 Tax=Lacrimispora amygdalina TaxID=253257 RepID=UPI000BE4347C|nr:LCP family protein [Lacrimispora amygdalina]
MKSKIIEIGAAVILAFLTVIAIFIFIGYKKVDNTIDTIQKIDKQEVKEMTNPNISNEVISTLKENWTVALFGLDSRNMENLSGTNSDVIIIASINNKTGDIGLMSVYRDTCLKTGDDRYKKVNEAYAMGGPKKAVEVLNENLDLQLDDYIAVNWKAVATAVNLLGGVDIELTKDELKYINGYITETVKNTGIGSVQIHGEGMHHLDGVQAVAYSRIRYTAGNDYKRTERQRTVLNAVLEKAKNSDWATLSNIITTVFPMTSSSINTKDVIDVAMNVTKYKLVKNGGFPFEIIEKNVDRQDFVFPDTLETNVVKAHEFLFGTQSYLPSEKVKEISKKIDNKRSGGINNKVKPPTTQETLPTEPTKESVVQEEAITQAETISESENYIETVPETKMDEIIPEDKKDDNYGPGFVNSEQEETKTENKPVVRRSANE